MSDDMTAATAKKAEINAAIDREDRRSGVRRLVTYAFAYAYLALTFVIVGILLLNPGIDPQRLQTVMSLYAGLSAAALGVIGYWFGNRDPEKTGKELDAIRQRYLDAANFPPPKPPAPTQARDAIAGPDEKPAPAVSKDAFDAALKEAKERFGDGRHPDVIGVGAGLRRKGGVLTNERVIRLFIREKEKDANRLSDESRVLPKLIKRAPVDVVAMPNFIQQATYDSVADIRQANTCFKPASDGEARAGLRFKTKAGALASFGAMVRDKKKSTLGFLTAAHTFSNGVGAQTVNFADERIGKSRAPTAENADLDAMVVDLDDTASFSSAIAGLNSKFGAPRKAKEHDAVSRIAGTTGLRGGIVEAFAQVDLSKISSQSTVSSKIGLFFVSADGSDSSCDGFTEHGDSGAIWFREENGVAHPVGLHIGRARCDGEVVAVAVDIQSVLDGLSQELA